MKTPPLKWLAAGLVLAGLAYPVLAQQASQPADPFPDTRAQAGFSDEMFLSKAMDRGVGEVAAAQLAVRQSGNEDIRNFAQQLAREHMAVNQELARAANRQLPGNRTGHSHELADLDGLQGQAFDRAWLEHMRKGHAKSIALYERAAREGETGQVRQLAEGTLPALREHAAAIDSLIARYGGGVSTGTAGQSMRDPGGMRQSTEPTSQQGEQDTATPPPPTDDGRA